MIMVNVDLFAASQLWSSQFCSTLLDRDLRYAMMAHNSSYF